MPNTTPLEAGRPPARRLGTPAAYKGRQVSAGIGSFVHPISARASVADLWSTMEIAAAGGETALQRAGSPTLDPEAKARLVAYVNQARQYYEATLNSDPVAKPLLGYYFILNATKAYLTSIDPTTTGQSNLTHGIGFDGTPPNAPYTFEQEKMKIYNKGIFQELAARTGRGHVWQPGAIQASRLLPYLCESVDLFSSSLDRKPHIIPISKIQVETSGQRPAQEAWLTVSVSRLAIQEAGLSPRKLLKSAAAFSAQFDLHDGSDPDFAIYQQRTPIHFTQMPQPLAHLRQAFDGSLIVRNRSLARGRDGIILSPHERLISNEALTFATMIHLSNMVRYHPHRVEALRGGRYWWLFTSWVDRACENYLLTISSRVSLEEHVVA